jgi:hypothetical protein
MFRLSRLTAKDALLQKQPSVCRKRLPDRGGAGRGQADVEMSSGLMPALPLRIVGSEIGVDDDD